jgi:hypothetical protein
MDPLVLKARANLSTKFSSRAKFLLSISERSCRFLMNNCLNHTGADILSVLRDARARIITWAPHTTLIFQELGICLFGVLKRRGQYTLSFDNGETTTGFLLKIYRSFKHTMIEPNIWGAF